jgi:hypothetical protein
MTLRLLLRILVKSSASELSVPQYWGNGSRTEHPTNTTLSVHHIVIQSQENNIFMNGSVFVMWGPMLNSYMACSSVQAMHWLIPDCNPTCECQHLCTIMADMFSKHLPAYTHNIGTPFMNTLGLRTATQANVHTCQNTANLPRHHVASAHG